MHTWNIEVVLATFTIGYNFISDFFLSCLSSTVPVLIKQFTLFVLEELKSCKVEMT